MPKAKTKQKETSRENLQIVIDVVEKDKDNTTVTISYKNTETASDIEKVNGATVYNAVCEAIKNLS